MSEDIKLVVYLVINKFDQYHHILVDLALVGVIVHQAAHEMDSKSSDFPLFNGPRDVGGFSGKGVEWNPSILDGQDQSFPWQLKIDFNFFILLTLVSIANEVVKHLIYNNRDSSHEFEATCQLAQWYY